MNLRPGTPTDAAAIARLIASFQREITDHPDGLGAQAYLDAVSEPAERGYLASDRYAFLLAEEADQLLGFIALRDVTHLFHLFVAREHQRRGVARALWQAAKARALLQAGPVGFTVNASLASVPAYQAFGFEPAGEVRSVHGISFLPMQLAVSRG